MRRFVICGAIAAVTALTASGQNPSQEQARPKTPEQVRPTSPDARPTGMQRHDGLTMARRSQKSSDLIGKKVMNASNEDLGKIEDIVVDAGSGRILYGVLSFGGFMGMGDKLFAIPWSSLELPTDAKHYVLNVSKDRLKTAEGFDKSQWPNFADESWTTKTYTYYEQKPYWQTDGTRASSGDAYRDRWYQRATAWQKASDLSGKDCHNLQNEDIGRISDLIIDPDGGRILYGVLANSGKRYAIPWNAVTLTADAKKFQVNLPKDRIKDAPSFSDGTWPNVTDTRWADEIHRYYSVQPYWADRPGDRPVTP